MPCALFTISLFLSPHVIGTLSSISCNVNSANSLQWSNFGTLSITLPTSSSGLISNVILERLSSVGGAFLVSSQSFQIGNVIINRNTPCAATTYSSISIQNSQSGSSFQEIALYGIGDIIDDTFIGGNAFQANLNKVILSSSGCGTFSIGGNLQISNSDSSGEGVITDVQIIGLASVAYDLTISSTTTPVLQILINSGTNSYLNIGGTLSIFAGSGSRPSLIQSVIIANLSNVNSCNIAAVGGTIKFVNISSMISDSITINSDLFIYGTAINGLGGQVSQVAISSLTRIAGALQIKTNDTLSTTTTSQASIESLGINSLHGLDIAGDLKIQAAQGTITSIAIGSLLTVGGDIEVGCLYGTFSSLGSIVISGYPDFGMYALGNIRLYASSVNSGSGLGAVTINNLAYVFKDIIVDPLQGKLQGSVLINENNDSPRMNIKGSIVVGSLEQVANGVYGDISFGNLGTVGGILVATSSNLPIGDVTFSGPIVPGFVVLGNITLQLQNTGLACTRTIYFSNIQEIQENFVAYQTSSTDIFCGVIFNGQRLTSTLIKTAIYNTAWLPNDSQEGCVNYCHGRGVQTLSKCTTQACTCWNGAYGSSGTCDHSGMPNYCSLYPQDCDNCACSSWTQWQPLAANSSLLSSIPFVLPLNAGGMRQRTRSCTSTSCPTSNVLGANLCQPLTQYEAAPPTFSTARLCALVTQCSPTQYLLGPSTTYGNTDCLPISQCTFGLQYALIPATATSDVVCANVSVCQSNFSQSVPPTATSDRVCQACTSQAHCDQCSTCFPSQYVVKPCNLPYSDIVCNWCSNQCLYDFYQISPCSATSDITCKKMTDCTLGLEYQIIAPTFTADRRCANLTDCNWSTQYAKVLPTMTTDRVCADISSHCPDPAHQYLAAAATITSNIICRTPSVCINMEQYQVSEWTATSDRICASLTLCNFSVQYELVPPTATTDRNCALISDCSHSYVSQKATETSDSICANCSVCNASSFLFQSCTAASDTQCRPYSICNSSSYIFVPRTFTSDVLCKQLSPPCLPSSQFELVSPTTTSDRICRNVTSCFHVDDIVYPSFAPSATLQQYYLVLATSTSDAVCANCSICNNNLDMNGNLLYFQAQPCTSTTDRICKRVQTCFPHIEYEIYTPTFTSDRVCGTCAVCLANFFAKGICSPTSNPTCTPYTNCTSEEYELVPPTAYSDRVCHPISQRCSNISSDFYTLQAATASSDRICGNYSFCFPGSFVAIPASPTSDRVCRNCTLGNKSVIHMLNKI